MIELTKQTLADDGLSALSATDAFVHIAPEVPTSQLTGQPHARHPLIDAAVAAAMSERTKHAEAYFITALRDIKADMAAVKKGTDVVIRDLRHEAADSAKEQATALQAAGDAHATALKSTRKECEAQVKTARAELSTAWELFKDTCKVHDTAWAAAYITIKKLERRTSEIKTRVGELEKGLTKNTTLLEELDVRQALGVQTSQASSLELEAGLQKLWDALHTLDLKVARLTPCKEVGPEPSTQLLQQGPKDEQSPPGKNLDEHGTRLAELESRLEALALRVDEVQIPEGDWETRTAAWVQHVATQNVDPMDRAALKQLHERLCAEPRPGRPDLDERIPMTLHETHQLQFTDRAELQKHQIDSLAGVQIYQIQQLAYAQSAQFARLATTLGDQITHLAEFQKTENRLRELGKNNETDLRASVEQARRELVADRTSMQLDHGFDTQTAKGGEAANTEPSDA